MRYLIQLYPLEPFFFGGDTTFGTLGSIKNGSYLAKSRYFPQQSAFLGMLKKEIMTQAGLLTHKLKGEWVDKARKEEAKKLVGDEKFSFEAGKIQNFGVIEAIGPLFLMQGEKRFVKKVDIDNCVFNEGLLEGYNPKKDIFNSYVSVDANERKQTQDIFFPVEQTGNKTGAQDNSLFKKTAFHLKDDFCFAVNVELGTALKNSIVKLGADGSKFLMQVKETDGHLNYKDPRGYMVLLSDSYITLPIKEHCDFAITGEINFRSLENSFENKKRVFQKTKQYYLYEKGSVFINPSQELLENLNNKNLQKVGFNHYTQGEK
ncbi:hypothetical protein LCX93_04890 [Sulfurimonas sp. SWIR-19]|uniref:type III-B CRISPR module-associated Cmr3 family protein n=1 Tax=Sulfurimonas sp. SWIR-19 TaxID=2878390 RepID=UPI001CF355B9|nr:type III-B CRISPR module-associated Cmr3 family protein [Sulfurimonas sp. SWIR-19]UCN01254.1 hypothetical protein LCX93_04890 [Sulfurimonas sp. SWIR-19]